MPRTLRRKENGKQEEPTSFSEGIAIVNKESFPSFVTKRQLDVEFNLLPRQKNHSCYATTEMRDLKIMCITKDSKEDTMKRDVKAIPMIPQRHLMHEQIDNRWRNYQEKDKSLLGEPEM